jgi:UDP-N-acetyl-2-amino-2-deoxyglucuronate dehydrogenase
MTDIGQAIVGRKIRFALVGCGRIARNHFASIKKYSDVAELVGICDIDPNALSVATTETGAKPFAKMSEMIAELDIDIVVLTTPSGLHAQQTLELARAGKHVITEKPMATNWVDGLKMVKGCEQAGVHLFVVKQNRLNATMQLLKKAIDSGRFGRIYMANINVFWTRPQGYYDSAAWRGTRELDGGAFMNQASHYIDLLNWLIGPIESLHAYCETLQRDIEVEDTGVISVKWVSGALGSVNVTMLTYPKNFEGSISILGEKGTVRVGGVAVNDIQHWEFVDKHAHDDLVREASYDTSSVYGFGHPAYYKNVIEVLQGTAKPQTDGKDGLKSLEVLIAAYMSSKEGRRITLPLPQ